MIGACKTCLVLGHASSGKSAYAERLVAGWPGRSVYFATARIGDDEIRLKVAAHRRRRGDGWRVVEAQSGLAEGLRALAPGEAALVDCATMWLANVMEDGKRWEREAESWIEAMTSAPARICIVSNDVGGGIVPANALARRFQRAQGELNQRLAAAAGSVVLVTAGLPLPLKGTLPE